MNNKTTIFKIVTIILISLLIIATIYNVYVINQQQSTIDYLMTAVGDSIIFEVETSEDIAIIMEVLMMQDELNADYISNFEAIYEILMLG